MSLQIGSLDSCWIGCKDCRESLVRASLAVSNPFSRLRPLPFRTLAFPLHAKDIALIVARIPSGKTSARSGLSGKLFNVKVDLDFFDPTLFQWP
jgi:hypothetical protein